MKRRDLLSACLDAVLAWVLTIAGIGCLTTGLDLMADMSAVALTALGFAVVAVLMLRLRKGWILALLTLALGAQLLWDLQFLENFYPQLKYALSYYHLAYGWGVPEWLAEYEPCDATLTACVIAAVCALLAGISLSKNWYIGALLALVVPVIPCIVVTNTVPEALYVWVGLVTMGVMTLTWNSRRMDARQANRLTALVLIPVVLASMLLFVRNPQSEYEAPNREEGVFLLMRKIANYLPFMNMTPGGSGTAPIVTSPNAVDLTTAGPRDQTAVTTMEVVASRTGVLYLRGRSYDTYTGRSWTASVGEETWKRPIWSYTTGTAQTLRVLRQSGQGLQYLTYYPSRAVTLTQGMVKNEGLDTYSQSFIPLRADWKHLWNLNYGSMSLAMMDSYIDQELSVYLQLPENTAMYARTYLLKAGVTDQSMLVGSAVDAIREYVQNYAPYDRKTGYMPQEEPDFVLWFLKNSDTGYCVHFASAAVVLLRAAGIPARYVEGYLVEAQAGKKFTVTTEKAHAWVEYYLPDVGWVILEATPPDGLPVTLPPEPTQPPETEPTEPTEPTETTKPTKPTVPTEPTEPTKPTVPTEPIVPTEPTEPTQPPTTKPVQTQPPKETEPQQVPVQTPRDWSGLMRVMGPIGLVLAAVLLVILQWCLRLWLRRRKMAGRAWQQVRARWRYACLLAKLCRHRPPSALEALAMKAKFSQHTLSSRELRQFSRYYAACIRGLRKHPWPLRLVYRLVLAAW